MCITVLLNLINTHFGCITNNDNDTDTDNNNDNSNSNDNNNNNNISFLLYIVRYMVA